MLFVGVCLEELSSESESENMSELTCKKNLFYDVRWEMVIEYCNNASLLANPCMKRC